MQNFSAAMFIKSFRQAKSERPEWERNCGSPKAEWWSGTLLLEKRLSPKPPSRKLLSLRKMPISQSTFFAEAKTFFWKRFCGKNLSIIFSKIISQIPASQLTTLVVGYSRQLAINNYQLAMKNFDWERYFSVVQTGRIWANRMGATSSAPRSVDGQAERLQAEGLGGSMDIIRFSSVLRSFSDRTFAEMLVVSFLIFFSMYMWRFARRAIGWRCVITIIWRFFDNFLRHSAIFIAVIPPIPASISSKKEQPTRFDAGSAIFSARATRDNSPPDAILRSSFGAVPGFADSRNSHLSKPCSKRSSQPGAR